MYLDDVLAAQKRGERRGIPSVCSAHPAVLRETLRLASLRGVPALIESTCNQVNQFGGYTGITPSGFAATVRGLATELAFPADHLILGGDHLGPSPWQHEPAVTAMPLASDLVQAYAQAGSVKLHLDCSMPLKDDPPGGPQPEQMASRAARLAQVAEKYSDGDLRYVIGTEVPPPGGAIADAGKLRVSAVADVRQALDLHREAFIKLGLQSAWDRVVAVVVQPGVEFGDDFVSEYKPAEASELSRFIEDQPLIYEAHSTDYQSLVSLGRLVRDHFAILKVGPALTYAYREALFALALIEYELFPGEERSNLIDVLDQVMVGYPKYWEKYYRGSQAEQAFKRKYSLSDRIRYYWMQADVQHALRRLMRNLRSKPIPRSLMSQFAPQEMLLLLERGLDFTPEGVISQRISRRLTDYFDACTLGA